MATHSHQVDCTWEYASAVTVMDTLTVMQTLGNAWSASTTPRVTNVNSVGQVSTGMPEQEHQMTVNPVLVQELQPQISSPRLVSWTMTVHRLAIVALAVMKAETAKVVLQATAGILSMDTVALLTVRVTGEEVLEAAAMPLVTASASLTCKARPVTHAKPVTST